MEITLRAAETGDFESYSRLFNQVNDVHVDAFPDTFRHVEGAPRTFEDYQALLKDPTQQVLLALLGGRVVGYVHTLLRERPPIPIMVPARFAVVDTLLVDDACRRKGIGRALMAAAEDWAQEHGAFYVELNVWKFNQSAVMLYEGLGYRAISQRMQKKL